MVQFDAQSVAERITNSLKAKASHKDILFYSTNRRLIDAFAEEVAYLAEYDEYLTRETKWRLAQNRTSLVAEAEFFNYKPYRKQGAKGTLKVGPSKDFSGGHAASITVPEYSVFSNGDIFFTSYEQRTILPGESYVNVRVVQGVPKQAQFTITEAEHGEGIEYTYLRIDNPNIDNGIYSLYVNGEQWEEINHIREAESGSQKAFVIKNEIDFSGIIIQLGNDIFGKRPEIGDTITFHYIETLGGDGNILRANTVTTVESSFTDSLGNAIDLYCTNDGYIANGTDYESVEEIRVNAPQSYQTGDRAMNAEDYRIILERDQRVSRVIVWGEKEINEDRGNPPGTYLPQEENMIYISGFYIDPNTDVGRKLSQGEKDALRDLLNDKKGPTDIINFVDTEFINVNFHVQPYVSDKRYSAEKIRENIESALMSKYSISNAKFRKNLYFSDYYSFIDLVEGVDHHRTKLSFNVINKFESAYELTIKLNLNSIKQDSANGGTVNIYVRNISDDADAWVLVAKDDGAGNLIGQPMPTEERDFDCPFSTIDYTDGLGRLLVTYGLDDNYTKYEVRIDFELDESATGGDLILTQRQQIFAYYDTIIDQVVHL